MILRVAIEYMHSRRNINRDLKMSNVGFDVRGDLKLFDFWLSRLLPPQSEEVEGGYIMSRVGTKSYVAREISRKEPYNLSADVYSLVLCPGRYSRWRGLAIAESYAP